MTLISIILADVTKLQDVAVNSFWEHIYPSLLSFGEKLIFAAIAYFVGVWLIRLIRKLVNRILVKKKVNNEVSSFIHSLSNTLLKLLLVMVIIGILGVPTTSFAAILAAGGLAIGMAMKDNLSNFAGGVMILLNKPIKLHDNIEVQGHVGSVYEIGILYTILITADGKTVFIPNGPLSTGNIINHSTQPNRRVDITLNISYGNDATELRQLIEGIVKSNGKVLEVPPPFVGITAINNASYDITIRAWGTNANYATIGTELNSSIYDALTNDGILVASTLTVNLNKTT